MFSFETLDVDLKAMMDDSKEVTLLLDDEYFQGLDDSEIEHGRVNATVSIRKVPTGEFSLSLSIEGVVTVACDRCLDDMDQPVEGEASYVVKLGETPSEDDQLIVVDEYQGILSLGWIIYETIVLAIPIKHVHAPGKCNDAMTQKLKELSATRSGDENDDQSTDEKDGGAIDPRWAKLSELKL